jgi:hypothetical protein
MERWRLAFVALLVSYAGHRRPLRNLHGRSGCGALGVLFAAGKMKQTPEREEYQGLPFREHVGVAAASNGR